MFQRELEMELEEGGPVRFGAIYEILAQRIEVIKETRPEHC